MIIIVSYLIALLSWLLERYVLSPLNFSGGAFALSVMIICTGIGTLALMQAIRRS
jgi:hypothetical protein